MDLKQLQDISNLFSRTTGVDGTIWISPKYAKHKPRFKFKHGDVEVSILIEKPEVVAGKADKIPADVLNKAFKWASENVEPLLKLWNGEYDSAETIKELKKV